MSLFKTFRTDKAKETEGVDIAYGANADGSIPTFKIARAGRTNIKFAQILEREVRPYERQIEAKSFDRQLADEVNMRVFVKGALLGWLNVQDAEGKTIEFNEDNALNLFRALPDLFDDLSAQSRSVANFRVEEVEAAAKN